MKWGRMELVRHHSSFRNRTQRTVRRYINEELIPKVEKNPSAYVGKITTTNYDTTVEKELIPKVTHYFLQAIFPVVGVLALGWAFVWVRRGFTSKN